MLRVFLLAVLAGVTECTVHEATLQALNGFLPTFREAAQLTMRQVTMRQARRLSGENYCKWGGNQCDINTEWAHAAATQIKAPVVLALAEKQLECEKFTSEVTCPLKSKGCKWDQGTCAYDFDTSSSDAKELFLKVFDLTKCGIMGKMMAAAAAPDTCAAATEIQCTSTDKCRQTSHTQISANGLECIEEQTCEENRDQQGSPMGALMCPDFDLHTATATCVEGKAAPNGVEEAEAATNAVNACIKAAMTSSCPALASLMKVMEDGAAVCRAHTTEGSCSGTCVWRGICEPNMQALMMSTIPADCPLLPVMELGTACGDGPTTALDETACKANSKCSWTQKAECGKPGKD